MHYIIDTMLANKGPILLANVVGVFAVLFIR